MKKDKTNQMRDLGRSLHKTSKENKAPIWLAISRALNKSRKNMARINLSRISRLTRNGDTVAVPGKVLGAGDVDHRVTVAALAFSASAREKIRLSGGTCITLNQLLEKNPKGTEVRIMR